MHKVIGHRDVGIDYFCEWLNGDTLSGSLFGIQVKTTERKDIKPAKQRKNSGKNELDIFQMKPSSFIKIKVETVEYWKQLNIPLFLFVVIKNIQDNFNCFYTRLTPILHEVDVSTPNKIEKIRNGEFYLANTNADFNAVIKKQKMDGGFVRDLFIDSVRCAYQSGNILYKNPNDLGLNNWTPKTVYADVLAEKDTQYVKKVKEGLLLLENVGGLITVDPNFERRVEELKDSLLS
jgi:hypothetical protein